MNEKKSTTTTLEKEGWTRRFVADDPRLSEAVEVYKEAGFEVYLQPFPTDEPECETCPGEEKSDRGGKECRICFEGSEDRYKIIFTRPAQGETESKDDL
ncbi:MAG: hypothetical protein JW896_14520 [Deltaproteobacteria bacterium]|nr:hypothetical protein [Deltaproteobacteria bacterium]